MRVSFESADALGVHRTTRFRWRHRFLHLAKDDRPAALAGIAEADELFLLEPQKGSRTLDRPARKRGGVAGRGAVTAAQLHRHLLPVLDQDVLLVTDGPPAYRAAHSAGCANTER